MITPMCGLNDAPKMVAEEVARGVGPMGVLQAVLLRTGIVLRA